MYPEAYLQNVVYRHATAKGGLPSDLQLMHRLPKTLDDPGFEAIVVPPVPLADFRAALRLRR